MSVDSVHVDALLNTSHCVVSISAAGAEAHDRAEIHDHACCVLRSRQQTPVGLWPRLQIVNYFFGSSEQHILTARSCKSSTQSTQARSILAMSERLPRSIAGTRDFPTELSVSCLDRHSCSAGGPAFWSVLVAAQRQPAFATGAPQSPGVCVSQPWEDWQVIVELA